MDEPLKPHHPGVRKKTGRRPKSSPRPTLDTDAPKPPRRIALPEPLRNSKVDTRSLKSGVYQRKVLAFFAPEILTEFCNSLCRNLRLSNEQTQKLTAEMFGFVQTGKAGVSVLVNQNNANNNNNENKVAAITPAARELSSPDEIYRQLDEQRQLRQSTPRGAIPLQLEATPVELNPEREEGLDQE